MSEEEELPEEADPVDIKEVNGLLTEHLNDIIHFGELVAYRAKRILQKKISENDLANPKKVDKVIDSVNLLVKLAGENMQHTVEFLTSRHKHWVKKVRIKHKKAKSLSKHVSSTVDNVKRKKDDIPNTDIQDEKVNEDNKKMSSGSDLQVNGNIESDEDDKPLIIHKKSVKETFATEDEEKSGDISLDTSVQNEETFIISENGALNENNSDAKEVDALEKLDNGKEVSENIDSTSEFDENEKLEKLKSKTSMESTENSSQEIKETGEVQSEKNVSEVHAEKTKGIKKNTAIELSEKDNSNDEMQENLNSVNVMETSNESDESISSKTTIKLRGLNESVEDIFADLGTSFQKKNTENIPHDDAKKQHIVEEKESKEEMDVSSNGTSTIELVCSQISDEDSVGTNAVVDKSHNKSHLEKNCKEEDSMSDEAMIDDVNNDSEASDPLALDQPKTEDKSEKRKSVKAKKCNDNGIKIDPSNSENEDIDTDKSRLSDSHLEENSDGERPNEHEDNGLAKNEEEEKDDNVDECIEAQEALLGYSSDEESGEEEEDYNEGQKHKKRRKKKGKMRNLKEIDEKREDSDTKIKKKGHIGPKSKTQQLRSSLSSSSGTDINSDSSGDIMLKRGKSTKKRRLKLKDTEAYRNDKKLGWKCSVDVERLCEGEFQKYYSNYSDVDEAAKNTRDDDKEIKR